MRKLPWIPAWLATAILLAGCATAPTGRSQLILVSDADMNRMGVTTFDRIKSQGKVAKDPGRQRYVRCVADALIAQLPAQWRQQPWEVVLIADDSANAFALPGGKVGVHTGLLKVAANQDQLASVIGHELGHVVSRHAAERVSQQFAADAALKVLDAGTGGEQRALLGLLGVGAQAGVLLPFSRKHESEADILGQRYMAAAGFDPDAAAALWRNMVAHSGGQRAPAWLSTHPDPQQRIRELEAAAPSLRPVYQQARAAGRRPDCE
ncbi:M48 family metallopeptidase [Arenimonas fontis]|uniref:M48 family metallopeptidase n=1 Tax=Arenimonas fontis TaxID=2608255 RepID=A0A5B2ZCQ8_9GAMM|nr:M48 family metallopeptidase [Arenimonas fontis]KAA2285787.1 M48 family metallopeptidase [Arenimonas fontis]